MTVRTILEAAMKKIGVLAPRETANTNDLADCLAVLQVMLRAWAGRRIVVFSSVRESKVLTVGTASYSWGVGGDITTTRPNKILDAFIRDANNQDYPVDIISEQEYNRISNKTTQGRPERLFYHPLYPLGYIYLYYTPNAAETLWLESMKQFTETSSFTATTDTIQFPQEYEEPMIYGLAVRIAPEFGKAAPAEVVGIVNNSYESVLSLNAANQVTPISLNLPVRVRGKYNINEG